MYSLDLVGQISHTLIETNAISKSSIRVYANQKVRLMGIVCGQRWRDMLKTVTIMYPTLHM